jgi:hypothetical protein
MRRAVVLAVLSVVLSACGESPSQQAEQVGSLAAEGSLLAHDASEPHGTTNAYTRVHASELASTARTLVGSAPPRVARLAREVANGLDRLADDPEDRDAARRLERRLRRAADEADRLAERS